MSLIERQAAEEAFEQGFHGIPSPKERAKMSPEKLAIELSMQKKGSPQYILLEHELNLRLAKEQSNATREAGRFGGFAAILSAILSVILTGLLGFWLGSSQTKEPAKTISCPTTTCNCAYTIAPVISVINDDKTAKRTNGRVNSKP